MSMDVGLGVMGTKLGMMTHFRPDGEVVPVTVVGFKDGNIVTQIKLEATHGYNSVQIGYDRVLERHLTKPEIGHLSKSGIPPLRHLQEFRLRSSIVKQYLPGQQLVLMELFKEGDRVDVSGITIGKGFQGVMKRHGFSGGPSSHGSRLHRRPGSIASGTSRVFPGKKMPGKMGCKKRKSRGLEIVKIDPEHRVVLLKGGVPGKHGNLLRIAPTKLGHYFFPKD